MVNLVNIFSEILNNIELDIETSSLWLPYTINIIIDKSIELPTVSSLYKILTIIFEELDWCTLLENIENNNTKKKILEYVKCVMEYVHTFKGEIQFYCLEMLMSLPSIVIKEIFNTQIFDIVKVIITQLSVNITVF